MHPILFSLGNFHLYSYGLMMALGVLAGMQIVDSEAKRLGWNRDEMSKLVVLTFLVGLLGSRIVYIITLIGDPNVDLLEVALNFRAGFVYYGGFIAAWLFLVWRVWKMKISFWDVMDAFTMGICVGLMIGRIGCLLGGCCYGKATTLPWGVVMVQEPQLGPVHPTQIYEALFLLVLFGFLWWRRKHKKFPGELTIIYTFIYAIGRFLIECLRGDGIRGFVIPGILSTSQAISIGMILVVAVLYPKLKKHGNRHSSR